MECHGPYPSRETSEEDIVLSPSKCDQFSNSGLLGDRRANVHEGKILTMLTLGPTGAKTVLFMY